jgi:BirA family biotin operon repressor/biotin-[acetyl-CoA-carboxylase] ligase
MGSNTSNRNSSAGDVYTEHVELCSSTMDLAKERLLVTEAPIGIITASQQTAGRGRRGNSWQTPVAGFLGTFWIVTELDAARLSGLSIASGVLMVRVLERLGADVWLKWPNDLVTVDSRKLGGILVEVGSSDSQVAGGSQFVLVGIGVNAQAPGELSLTAAGLTEITSRNPGDGWGKAIRDGLAAELPSFWREFSAHGVTRFLPEWRARCLTIGKEVSFTRGERRETATFVDVGEAGEAILDVNGVVEKFFSGEIHTVRTVSGARR